MAPENKREKALKRIAELGAWYLRLIEGVNDLDLYDINVISEDFFVELFQEVYDYRDLKNLNSESANYPGIDLGDESAGVAVQITTNKRGQKVKETLQKFVANEDYERFPRLIIYIIDKKQASYSDAGWEAIIGDRFEFDPQEDIRDHGDLLRNINALRLEKIQRVEEIFERYFGGNGEEPPLEKLAPYLEAVVRRSRNLPLTALDPGQKSTPIPLGQVFINLDAGLEERVSSGSQPGMKRYSRYSSALGHIYEKERLILLGDPGSGKSTLLRYLACCLAQHTLDPEGGWLAKLQWQRQEIETRADEGDKVWAALDERRARINLSGEKDESQGETITEQWTEEAPVPVFIELRNFARSALDVKSPMVLWNYYCGHLKEMGLDESIPALRYLLLQGRLIFLLDGVDEVAPEERPRIWQAIESLDGGALGSNRWLATCRILSFDAQKAPEGVPERTLQPLTLEQILRFIDCWYRVLEEIGELSAERAESLTTHLQQQTQRPSLQELAQNPMLLTIMALVQSYYGTLPEERARLYQACVDTLLLRWQLPKEETVEGKALPDMLDALGVNQQKLERLLWEIAWQAHSGALARQERADIKEGEIMTLAAKHLGGYKQAERFLTYTEQRAHLLVGLGGLGERVFVFPHRTFQEYLAACYLTPGMRLLKEAPRLAEEGDTWREVLTLASGALVYNNNNFEQVLFAVEHMLPYVLPAVAGSPAWYRIWLAAEMASVVGRGNFEASDFAGELLPRLREQLVALLEHEALTPPQRADAGRCAGQVWATRAPAFARRSRSCCRLRPASSSIKRGGAQLKNLLPLPATR